MLGWIQQILMHYLFEMSVCLLSSVALTQPTKPLDEIFLLHRLFRDVKTWLQS
ncbi:hypothetical protein Plhal304r1_c058g0145601 [Plasmopara halstedii]